MGSFAIQTLAAGGRMARHRHAEGYAALVLSGGYVEAGDRGRFHARPGMVLIHGAWESHMDAVFRSGAVVLNLPLAGEVAFGVAEAPDPDLIARTAERDITGAVQLLHQSMRPLAVTRDDWPDALAAALRRDPGLSVSLWAERAELAPATVSRGFRQAFGASPRRYRAEQRALAATRGLLHRADPPAALAAEFGFVDQAHMTRAVGALTGFSPGRLRVKSVQSGGRVQG